MRKVLVRSVLVALVALAGAVPGWAQEGITPLGTSLSDGDLDRRIEFIEQRLDGSKKHGQYWYWGWLTVNGGSMIGHSVAFALSGNHDDRVDYGTTAVTSAIGVADVLFRPLEARLGAEPIQRMPQATREQKIAKLRKAESQLRGNAERADERWGVVPHAANAGMALGAGLVVGLWGEEGAGYITGITTLVGGIANLLTQPGAPKQDWKDYKALAGGRAHLRKVDVYVSALPDGAKAGVRLEW